MSDGLKDALPCNDGYVGSGDTKDFLDDNVVNIEFSECTKKIDTQFSGFTSLHDVDLTIQNAEINKNAFNHTSGITSLTIGSGCTFVDYSVFANMLDLKRVKLEEGLTDLGESMFDGCTSLSSITIPNGVTRIGQNAFSGCTSLTNIEIPDSIDQIDYRAFYGCSALTSVTIGSGVTRIENYAFQDCTNLTSVTINATTPPTLYPSSTNSKVFYNTNNCPIYVPAESVSAYKAQRSWYAFKTRIQAIPNS